MEGPQKTDEKEALNSEEQYGWNISRQETVALLIRVTLPTTPHTQEGCGDRDWRSNPWGQPWLCHLVIAQLCQLPWFFCISVSSSVEEIINVTHGWL